MEIAELNSVNAVRTSAPQFVTVMLFSTRLDTSLNIKPALLAVHSMIELFPLMLRESISEKLTLFTMVSAGINMLISTCNPLSNCAVSAITSLAICSRVVPLQVRFFT